MQNFIGKNIDRYRIIAQQGMGGMAVVYQAYDTRLERDVAVKVIRTEAIPPEQYSRLMARFEREAKAQAAFSHPNIVPVYDYGEVNGAPYLVMEFIAGGTLKDKLVGPFNCHQVLRWLVPIASALSYAHKYGVVHRDVKPSNILFDKEGRPVLADFGIAKILETTEATLTGTGLGVGTPEYMAPEQWHGQANEASDQYALGVVLYELLTGHKPYTAETPVAVALKQMNEPLPRPKDLVTDIPDYIEKVLYKALAPSPQDRFENMQVFHNVLLNLLRQYETPLPGSIPDVGWPDSEAETVDLLAGTKSAGARIAKVGQPSPHKSKPQTKKKSFPIWGLLIGLGVILVGLICVGGAILLSNADLLGRRSETAQQQSSRVEIPTDTPVIVAVVEEVPILTEDEMPTPTASQEPSPTQTPKERPSPTAETGNQSPTRYITPTPNKYYPIAGCAESQLRLGDSAFVSYTGGKNSLRSSPDTSTVDNRIGEIQPGEVVIIIDGPVCNFGWVLWKIETTSHEQGWTPESNGTDFWLYPLSTRELCEGAMPSRLVIGKKAKVNEEPPQANLLRPEPSRFHDKIGRIPPGEWMLVLDGPHCGENTVWWQVEDLATGVIGWTMESEPGLYYLSPEP